MIPWLVLQGSIALLGSLPIPTEVDTIGIGVPESRLAQGAAAPDASPAPVADDFVRLYAGQRMFDEDFWSPLEDQITLGLEFAHENSSNFVGWEAGVMYSYDEDDVSGFDVDASSWELYGGVRKTLLDPARVLRPYVGAGLAWITGDVEVSGVGSDDDDSFGVYLHGGLDARITRSFFLGADLRTLLGTDIDIAGVSGDADYVQLALVLGWSI